MLTYLLALSLVAAAPEIAVESNARKIDASQVELEEMLDALNEEEIVFEDLEFSSDEEDIESDL